MNNLEEQLKEYEVAGRALQEMLDEHSEMSELNQEDVGKIEETRQKTLGRVALKVLGESILKEMGPMASYGPDRSPYPNCPKKVMKLQKLVRFVDRLLNDYKELYFTLYNQSEDEYEVADDLKEMMASSIKIILGSAIGKMQSVWNEKEEPRETSGDPSSEVEIEIIPQDEVKSPAGDTYKVVEEVDNSVKLIKKSTGEQFNVAMETFKKWKSS